MGSSSPPPGTFYVAYIETFLRLDDDGNGGVDLIWAVLILGVRLEEILLEKLTAERGAAR